MLVYLQHEFDMAGNNAEKQSEIYNRSMNDLTSIRKAVFGTGGVFGPDVADVFQNIYARYVDAAELSDLYDAWLVEEDKDGNENLRWQSETIKSMIEVGTRTFMDELRKTIEYMEEQVIGG